MNLCTTDNNCGAPFSGTGEKSLHGTKSDYANLSKIANTTVAELVKNNPSLLVFPQILGAHDDGIDEQGIFNLHGNPEKLEDVKLNTGNLMGFIGIGGTQLKISSRFSKDDENDFFVQYMLQKVFSINLFDWELQNSNGVLDLLMFVFPKLLKKALSQGLYRQYQTFNRNDANLKGVVDVSRHIKQNVPFCGKIAYNSRERTFDNPLTELIRHTIENKAGRKAASFKRWRNKKMRAGNHRGNTKLQLPRARKSDFPKLKADNSPVLHRVQASSKALPCDSSAQENRLRECKEQSLRNSF